jgi:hypothetical protein
MAENDPSLMAGYVAGTIESRRKSVDKVLAGADFEKKLVTLGLRRTVGARWRSGAAARTGICA